MTTIYIVTSITVLLTIIFAIIKIVLYKKNKNELSNISKIDREWNDSAYTDYEKLEISHVRSSIFLGTGNIITAKQYEKKREKDLQIIHDLEKKYAES